MHYLKRKKMLIVSIGLLLISSSVIAQEMKRSSGMILRGSFWSHADDQPFVSVSSNWGSDDVFVGHGGGWMVFFSRTSDRSFLELSIGCTGQVISKSQLASSEEVKVKGVFPVLFGAKYNILPSLYQNGIDPYFSFGGGPYWISDIHVIESGFDDEVSIKTKVNPGVYGGVGFDFMLGSWFGINLDMKYHFINFDVNHDMNGFEFGLGFCFRWGQYN